MITLTIDLPDVTVAALDKIIEREKFSSRSEAIEALVAVRAVTHETLDQRTPGGH